MNNLINLLKSKINSTALRTNDKNQIISDDDLKNFLTLSLCELNQSADIHVSFENEAISEFSDILIEGAMLHLLARQAIEQARPNPNAANLIQGQWETLLHRHDEKLMMLKDFFASSYDNYDYCDDDVCDACKMENEEKETSEKEEVAVLTDNS